MIIKCPECGKEISDESKICIHCGYPIAKHIEENKKKEYLRLHPNEQPKAYKVFDVIQKVSLILFLICIFIFLVILLFTEGKPFDGTAMPFSILIITEIIGLLIDILICGIFKSCFRRK